MEGTAADCHARADALNAVPVGPTDPAAHSPTRNMRKNGDEDMLMVSVFWSDRLSSDCRGHGQLLRANKVFGTCFQSGLE